ncbi:MAG: sigma-54 dependent transcriptional regulator [candidate division Zixibacteria bacterium]|nr:sigma-54 dependent transcriptional regulator [candidate division Zixibacteria bacterium]MDH3939155.1 sigma-54 dependent transcriptional regulator [candidate division Zixibacteria bacterium]MDH4034731.1 sigma-54 dependent transcriptional regulator [candidate division Zixibacteria bacterium]
MTEKYGRILVVDDDEDVLQAARLFLKQHVSRVRTETSPECLPDLVNDEEFDVYMLDMNFTKDVTSGQEGLTWLDKILQIDPGAVVILITAFADVDLAVKAIKYGATDFVEKPWQNEKLLATVMSALKLSRSRREVGTLRQRQLALSEELDLPFRDFIGSCDAMQKVFGVISKVAVTEANVLILGENGTGKELAARAVHRQSARAGEVFVKVDMGSISETLFESELFGHVKGAFTDAREDRAGRFETATGGTLFLDEIGNLPLPLQVKLLTVLQNRKVTRVGSNSEIPIDIRLICASNVSLIELAREGKFREDLLYRINTVEVQLPPLRERPDDMAVLAEHFMRRYAHKYRRTVTKLSASCLTKLRAYGWPGNVRELEHTIERAVIMCDASTLQPEDFVLSSAGKASGDLLIDSFRLEEVEKTVIRKALAKHDGNVTRTARELGLTRAALYRRLDRYGL